jgi:tetratricopeptide (TPR) repeat protein
MRHCVIMASLCILGSGLFAAGCASVASTPRVATVPLQKDLGLLHHPITTTSPWAQRYFDQGLRLTYAFNHAEAIAAYEQAAMFDPNCAMCEWGIALALGPNINMPMKPEAENRAYEAIQKALALADHASEPEQAYIHALATRYGAEAGMGRATRDAAYAHAMRELAKQYPKDIDAAVLFAEALMNLQPWDYWTREGEPKGATAEIVTVLESALAAAPDHPGACHYYIHTVEASPAPERAIACAEQLPRLMPGAGHLVHMPAHIYLRVGRYHDAVERNQQAVDVDEHYIEERHPSGIYPMMYYPHNLYFLWAAAAIEGQRAVALEAAHKLAAQVSEATVRDVPTLQVFVPVTLFTWARFGMWQEILNAPAPPEEFRYTTGIWHYARGLALTEQGRFGSAQEELDQLRSIAKEISAERIAGIKSAAALLRIAANVLAGELAAARGKTDEAIGRFEAALADEERVTYDEPLAWYQPVRQFLGAVLFEAGRPAQAEAVYREDLKHNPENGWSLYGLMQSLQAQDKETEAAAVEQRFNRAWAYADVALPASRF